MSSDDGRAGRAEQPAVKTTIVGGRPPGPGKGVGEVPRGIEVLVKKASVDSEFRALLLERRSGAADEIGLTLEPAEAMMLDAVPAGQLKAVIDSTEVSPQRRRAFLGRAAAVMLAALGASVESAFGRTRGIKPDRPPATHVLYKATDCWGRISYELVSADGFRARQRRAAATNTQLGPAYARAAAAWRDDATHAAAFPLPKPQPVRLVIVTNAYNAASLEQARALLDKRRAEQAEADAAARKKEQDRLGGLSAEERERERAKATARAEAEALFAKTLKKLTEQPPATVLGIQPMRPPAVSRGISYDRPPSR